MIEPVCSAPDPRAPARGLLIGYLALSPVVFWYEMVEPFEVCKSTLTSLTALALMVLAVTAARGRSWPWTRAELRDLFREQIGVAVLCGVLSALLSTAFSLSPRTSLLGAPDSNMGLLSVLALGVLFAASRALCRDEAAVEQVLSAAMIGLALSSAYALVQALGFDPVRWVQTREYRGWHRPSGTQGHPNQLAGHVVMVLPIVLWQIRRAVQVGQRGRALAGIVLALLAALTVTISLSRAALLAGGLAVLVLLIGWGVALSRRAVLALVLVAVCLGAVVYFGSGNRLESAILERLREPLASSGRWPIWQGAVQLFVDHPWTGTGLDTFGLLWPGVRTPEYWEVEWGFLPGKAHNDFLHALATQGIFGATAWLMLPLALMLSLAKAWRQGRRRDQVLVLASITLAFYLQNLVGFAVASTAGLLAIVAGMIVACPGRRDSCGEGEAPAEPMTPPPARQEPRPPACRAAAWLGALLVLLTLWQGSGGQVSWRLALVALALFWGAIVGLAASPGGAGSCFTRKSFLPTLRAWRPVALPAMGGMVLAGFLLCPLLASALSFRAEQWMPRDPSTALSYHERAVSVAPWCPLLHERRSKALWQEAARQESTARGRELLRSSRESIETACRLEPLAARFHANRARILFDLARQGLIDPTDVLTAFDRARALDRCDWFVLADAARAAATLGCLSECERYLEAGLSKQPDSGMLLAERGALELARGQPGAAERRLREALEADWFGEQERFDRATLLLGMVLLETGRPAEALDQVQGVLDRHRDWIPARLLHARSRDAVAGIAREPDAGRRSR
jgi:O-antigen ligase